MSKVDAQRAMREAKYARNRAGAPNRGEAAGAVAPAPAAAPAARPPRAKPAQAAEAAPSTPGAAGELCGHKSMNGRACTREAAHPEKSHRYG